MPTKGELQQQVYDLTEVLKKSDTQVNSLENDVDYYIKEVNDLMSKIEELESGNEKMKEQIEKINKEPDLKQIKEMLCDRYSVNHHTKWVYLIHNLKKEVDC